MTLPTVPNCDDDAPQCEAYDIVEVAKSILVSDEETNCPKALAHLDNSIPYDDGTKVEPRDGSATLPLKFPNMQRVDSGPFSFLVGALRDGSLILREPYTGTLKHIVTTNEGGFNIEPWLGTHCFPDEDICECTPNWLAGYEERTIEGVDMLCLVKLPLADFEVEIPPNFHGDTVTVDQSGAGTAGDPFVAEVNVSADDGNRIEIRPDGLYVPPLPTPCYGWCVGGQCYGGCGDPVDLIL